MAELQRLGVGKGGTEDGDRGRDKDDTRNTDSEIDFPPVGVRTAGQLSRPHIDFSFVPQLLSGTCQTR